MVLKLVMQWHRDIPQLVIFIYGLISGWMIPNLSEHGFLIGWSRFLHYMLEDEVQYA